ncbi:MAG TPA: hypothetical protein VKT27_14150 [Candidatus Binataceae bacterium]|nr:hypothetical protein [Candidatus Binataceae bacterium]
MKEPRARLAFDGRGILALAIYTALAVSYLARGLSGRWPTAYIGKGVDPPQLMWLMSWWPHALARGLNPFHTDAIWAPHGLNLAWATSMPLISVIAAVPILVAGPIHVYNALCVLAVALAAWSAFALCRYLSGAYYPSLIGGYVFGFSAYMLGQSLAHLDLLLVFPLPLFALLLIRAFKADIEWRALVVGLILLLIAQFLMFIELFATMTFFAGIAFLAMLIAGSGAERTRAVNLLPTVVLSYAIALLALAPIFYWMVASGYESGAQHPAILYSLDLLNLIVPTATIELGRAGWLREVSNCFLGYIYEAGGYIGIPLMLVAAAFARSNWGKGWARALVTVLVVVVILSLGPFLIVAGRPILPLPGLLLGLLPLIGKALPVRFMLYAFLMLTIVIALWLADDTLPSWIRGAAATIIVLSMLPNLSARFWTSAIDLPSFFGDSLYAKYLSHGATVVILPYGINGNSMLWQLESRWYFKMAGGYSGNPPLVFRQWPIVRAFYRVGDDELPDAGDQLKAFLATHRVAAVLVDDRELNVWRPLLETLDTAPTEAGGMTLYRIDENALAPWRNATALEMETRLDRARFAALVLAADAYVRGGHPLTALTPAEVKKLGLMPPGWIVVPKKTEPPWDSGGLNLPRHPNDPRQLDDLWLGRDEQGRVEVGVSGWYPALRAVLAEYRGDAIGFVPRGLEHPSADGEDDLRGRLVMTFSAEGLARAAAHARDSAAAGRAAR